jgi:hypothetical protein
MKKFLAVLAIAGTLVACDNAGTDQATKDSIAKAQADSLRQDSINKAAMQTPTTPETPVVNADSLAKAVADSLHQDSVKKGLIK